MAANMKLRFLETLRQSIFAYAFNIFGIVAGATLAYHIGMFSLAPWVVAVYPSVVSARGVIGGLFSGRLSTGLHLGMVKPHFFGNTEDFYLLLKAIVVMTLETSIAMSLVAALFGSIFQSITAAEVLNMLTVTMATMTLALVCISPLTMAISFASFTHGLDPDIVLYPIESTVSDLAITAIYISFVNLFLLFGSFGQYVTISACLVLLFAAAYLLPKNLRKPQFAETLREFVITLVFVAFIVNVTGFALSKIAGAIGGRKEIYTVYPAMIDTMGDVGAVVGSTATTKLALGLLKPSFLSIKEHATEISGAWAASLIMFLVYSAISLVVQGLFSLTNLLGFAALLINANLIAGFFIIVVSYAVAILTHQRGLDPDNFVIPIESSLADSLTTISLLIALSLFGGLGAAA